MVKVLALDLARLTGVAYNGIDGKLHALTEVLASPGEVTEWHKARMDRRCDPRPGRLFNIVRALHAGNIFDVIVFEDVQFMSYTLQCQMWASLRTAVWIAFRESKATIECVPTNVLKQFGAHHGGATKGMMATGLVRAMPERFAPVEGAIDCVFDREQNKQLDDNAVDALHLWRWAQLNLSRIHR